MCFLIFHFPGQRLKRFGLLDTLGPPPHVCLVVWLGHNYAFARRGLLLYEPDSAFPISGFVDVTPPHHILVFSGLPSA
jgi:hypothetical protein